MLISVVNHAKSIPDAALLFAAAAAARRE